MFYYRGSSARYRSRASNQKHAWRWPFVTPAPLLRGPGARRSGDRCTGSALWCTLRGEKRVAVALRPALGELATPAGMA
jgi:hypothetical protein